MLSAVARVFDRLVHDQLSDYLERNNYFLTKYQSGVRKFHSTVTALLKTSNNWLLNMDKGLFTGNLQFDLKKAFDTVDHYLLKLSFTACSPAVFKDIVPYYSLFCTFLDHFMDVRMSSAVEFLMSITLLCQGVFS